jgi:hypothetical protein
VIKVKSLACKNKKPLENFADHITIYPTRSRGLTEKLTGSQLVKNFATLYGTRRFITATCSYPEPEHSSPSPIPDVEDPF